MGPRVSETGTLTGIALAIIAILAILTVAAIVAGARKKRARAEADRIERERVAKEAAPTRRPALGDADVPAAAPPPAPTPAPEPEPLVDEPVAAAAPLDASPAVEAQPVAPTEPEALAPEPAPPPPPAPVREPRPDAPVTTLKGLGPKVAALLAEQGVTTVGDLAALDARAAEDLDARLGAFTGRMARDRWIEQARLLAEGDVNGYEARFGKL